MCRAIFVVLADDCSLNALIKHLSSGAHLVNMHGHDSLQSAIYNVKSTGEPVSGDRSAWKGQLSLGVVSREKAACGD